jgi:two-component system chemotaxis response regulator CheB
MWKIKDELIALVQTAASAEIKMLLIPKPKKIIEGPRTSKKVVVVGASSGGPPAVESILAQFPGDFPAPLLVVQHMPPYFTRSFAKRLNRVCLIRVKEAEEGDRLEPGQALVAPGGHNVGLRKKVNKLFVKLSKGRGGLTPSVDLALESVARYCDGDAIAVILTGMGSDGSRGVRLIKEEGGKVICQDMATSLIFGMPARVIEQGNADFVLPLRRIGKKIVELL